MLNNIIKYKTNEWLQSDDCTVKSLVKYIRDKGELRDTQIQALETYLFLKVKGENKPLWQLFADGFFTNGTDLSKLNINQNTRDFLANNKSALALFDFARQKNGKTELLPELVKLIIENPESIDYEKIIKDIFYNVSYADYLMSLPMGAGKTFLMASIIYLDLYFAQNEPDNKNFAHNFLVLIPSGLKSSIVPSLKTIEKFDPSWVLPEPSASNIKKLLKFDILDQAKTGNKSNKARNPNAQKVNQCLPNPFGQVFVVNAEKVILNRTELDNQLHLIERTEDEKDVFANELRNLIGKIPNLSILIDEVHHATDGDIKLRQVVNKWQETGNITTVLGFSGTPYLSKADKINVTDTAFFKFTQITNTVYYYPLVTAITKFLKTPKVKVAQNLNKFQIIEKGISDFQKHYKKTVYKNGNIAKIAIYCSNIESLEEEIYPFLTGELKINPNEILRYHKGNKQYKLPKENELLFNTLDVPKTISATKKRYVLLVQIGKEGWDCPSLTGIILAQKGASPKNMVLQTSCRCLRQVDKEKHETARIWLNEYNATVLNQQLKKEQQTSIEELNKLDKKIVPEKIERFARIEHLQLPSVEFYQLQITYNAIEEEEKANTKPKLKTLLKNIDAYKNTAIIKSSGLSNISDAETDIIEQTGTNFANYNSWIFDISKASFNKISVSKLNEFETILKQIFAKISYKEKEITYYNELYDLYYINAQIRIAFSIIRNLQTESEVLKQDADLLIVDNLKPVDENEKLYPTIEDTKKILELDKSGKPTEIETETIKKSYEIMKQGLVQAGMEAMVISFEDFSKQYDFSNAIKSKDKTFHYLPYDFKQSGFEKQILKETLNLTNFKNSDLEIYFNGERGLTEFVINCYAKENTYWKNIGKYTTDFLIIKRKNKEIHKALIIETKGEGYANDPVFLKKKKFVETQFLEQNKDKFGYNKFDFLYLIDSDDLPNNLSKLNSKIDNFFNK